MAPAVQYPGVIPAVEMAVGETPRRRFTDLVLVSVDIKTKAVEMAVGETPGGRFTDLVLVSVGMETLAVEMAARRRAVELQT
jgi:hypothetical protein